LIVEVDRHTYFQLLVTYREDRPAMLLVRLEPFDYIAIIMQTKLPKVTLNYIIKKPPAHCPINTYIASNLESGFRGERKFFAIVKSPPSK